MSSEEVIDLSKLSKLAHFDLTPVVSTSVLNSEKENEMHMLWYIIKGVSLAKEIALAVAYELKEKT